MPVLIHSLTLPTTPLLYTVVSYRSVQAQVCTTKFTGIQLPQAQLTLAGCRLHSISDIVEPEEITRWFSDASYASRTRLSQYYNKRVLMLIIFKLTHVNKTICYVYLHSKQPRHNYV